MTEDSLKILICFKLIIGAHITEELTNKWAFYTIVNIYVFKLWFIHLRIINVTNLDQIYSYFFIYLGFWGFGV